MKKKIIVFALSFVLILFNFYIINAYLLDDVFLYHPYETLFFDNSDNKIRQTINGKNALYINYEEIPQEFIIYLLAIEDRDYFKHNGVNINRLLSSIINNLSLKNIQGGSTITMQLARMLFLNNKKNIFRKFEEIQYAKKLEKELSKEKILEYYLNLTYFAHGIYGLRSASFFYFSKDISFLNKLQYIMLIGIINSPNNYSPYLNYDKSISKVKSILKTLVKLNFISQEEVNKILNLNLDLKPYNEENYTLINYYFDSVEEEIKKKKLINKYYFRHGIKIKTFLDLEIQNYIENLVHEINFDISNVAICIMKTNSPEVLSLIGGKDYNESSFNRAIHTKKQIGSTIKPLIYYLALENKLSPLFEFYSSKTTFKIKDYGDYEVNNSNEIYPNRKITMLEALAMSDNIYAVKTLLALNVSTLVDYINSLNMNVDVKNITLALGSNSLSLLELTSIYNMIASNGIYYKPKFVKEITYQDNGIVYKANNYGSVKMYQKEAEILKFMLRAPFDIGLKTYASPTMIKYYINNFAAKTGSTKSSSYVIGFNNYYTIGIYVGNDNNEVLTNGYYSKILFQKIANYLNKKNEGFFQPSSFLKPFKLYNKMNDVYSFTYYLSQ